MQVLLKKDVPSLGQSGDVKNVKSGYARNYLIPNDLVIPADAKTKKEQLFLKKVQERKAAKRKKEAEGKVSEFTDISVELKARLGTGGKLYGSVTNIDIHKALVAQDLMIDRKMVILDEPIKTLGVFKVPLKLYQGVHVDIQVIVTDERGEDSIQEPEEKPETTTEEAKEEDASDERGEGSIQEPKETPETTTEEDKKEDASDAPISDEISEA